MATKIVMDTTIMMHTSYQNLAFRLLINSKVCYTIYRIC